MGKTSMAIFLFTALGNSQSSWADDSAHCYNIRDSDRKQFCLAQVTGERSRYQNIRDHDLRVSCQAGMGW